MPLVSARSFGKNMSKGARAKALKNINRVDAAINDDIEGCTYGKVCKALGNKMFTVVDMKRREHIGFIRGKMARVVINDIVLLNVRDYESRSTSTDAVYDIMAIFNSRKDISRLVKADKVPSWFMGTGSAADAESDDLFDYSEEDGSDATSDEEADEESRSKKDKKNHRANGSRQRYDAA